MAQGNLIKPGNFLVVKTSKKSSFLLLSALILSACGPNVEDDGESQSFYSIDDAGNVSMMWSYTTSGDFLQEHIKLNGGEVRGTINPSENYSCFYTLKANSSHACLRGMDLSKGMTTNIINQCFRSADTYLPEFVALKPIEEEVNRKAREKAKGGLLGKILSAVGKIAIAGIGFGSTLGIGSPIIAGAAGSIVGNVVKNVAGTAVTNTIGSIGSTVGSAVTSGVGNVAKDIVGNVLNLNGEVSDNASTMSPEQQQEEIAAQHALEVLRREVQNPQELLRVNEELFQIISETLQEYRRNYSTGVPCPSKDDLTEALAARALAQVQEAQGMEGSVDTSKVPMAPVSLDALNQLGLNEIDTASGAVSTPSNQNQVQHIPTDSNEKQGGIYTTNNQQCKPTLLANAEHDIKQNLNQKLETPPLNTTVNNDNALLNSSGSIDVMSFTLENMSKDLMSTFLQFHASDTLHLAQNDSSVNTGGLLDSLTGRSNKFYTGTTSQFAATTNNNGLSFSPSPVSDPNLSRISTSMVGEEQSENSSGDVNKFMQSLFFGDNSDTPPPSEISNNFNQNQAVESLQQQAEKSNPSLELRSPSDQNTLPYCEDIVKSDCELIPNSDAFYTGEEGEQITIGTKSWREAVPLVTCGGDDTVDLRQNATRSHEVHLRGGNDTLYASDYGGTFYGNKGNDKLYGGRGDDTMFGGMGNDEVTGGLGGQNTLQGDRGQDILIGEGGSNTYIVDYQKKKKEDGSLDYDTIILKHQGNSDQLNCLNIPNESTVAVTRQDKNIEITVDQKRFIVIQPMTGMMPIKTVNGCGSVTAAQLEELARQIPADPSISSQNPSANTNTGGSSSSGRALDLRQVLNLDDNQILQYCRSADWKNGYACQYCAFDAIGEFFTIPLSVNTEGACAQACRENYMRNGDSTEYEEDEKPLVRESQTRMGLPPLEGGDVTPRCFFNEKSIRF